MMTRRDMPCLVANDIGTSMTIARHNITAGLSHREHSWLYILQMVSEKTLPVLKEALVEVTMGLECLLRSSLTSSSWDWMSCMPMMHPWILDILCLEWARKMCNYSAQEHHHTHPPPHPHTKGSNEVYWLSVRES